MTTGGGTSNVGTIFSINTDGSGYQNLASFNVTDGKYPVDGLTLSGSTLYGRRIWAGQATTAPFSAFR